MLLFWRLLQDHHEDQSSVAPLWAGDDEGTVLVESGVGLHEDLLFEVLRIIMPDVHPADQDVDVPGVDPHPLLPSGFSWVLLEPLDQAFPGIGVCPWHVATAYCEDPGHWVESGGDACVASPRNRRSHRNIVRELSDSNESAV